MVTNIIESPKYDDQGLVTSLGGALSLFLGISIISMFEIFELLVRGLKTVLICKKKK